MVLTLTIRYQFLNFHLTLNQRKFNLGHSCKITELLGHRGPQMYLVHLLPLPDPPHPGTISHQAVIYLLLDCHQRQETYYHQ